MAFDFVCPFCHAKFYVDDVYRGQSGRCAECNKPIQMPGRANDALESQTLEILHDQRKRRELAATAANVGVFVLAFFLLAMIAYAVSIFVLPELRIAKSKRDVYRTLSNLQTVARALNAYAASEGTYPTPVVTDSNGLPLYSWRVLILPQLGYGSLYSQFKLDQPWDGNENIHLMQSMPREYEVYGALNNLDNTETAIVLITGPGTLFPSTGPLGRDDVVDDLNQTILVTEALRVINTWTAPYDTTLSGATTIGTLQNSDIGIGRSTIAVAESTGVSDLILPIGMSNAQLRAIISPDGAEFISREDYNTSQLDKYHRHAE